MFWVFHVIRDYARTLAMGDSRMTAELPRFLALADELERAQKPLPIVFGHNDLLPANFLDDGERLWLIDFEYAGFTTAMFDLAGIASNAEMSETEADSLLAAYFGAEADMGLRKAFAAMQCASLLREAMWSLVSELHLDAPGADYVGLHGREPGTARKRAGPVPDGFCAVATPRHSRLPRKHDSLGTTKASRPIKIRAPCFSSLFPHRFAETGFHFSARCLELRSNPWPRISWKARRSTSDSMARSAFIPATAFWRIPKCSCRTRRANGSTRRGFSGGNRHVAESCPSGAITYRRKDGGPAEAPPVVNTVRLRENGPLAIHAEIEIGGETLLRATLCRCGASQNKPFCDSSHTKAGFAATGEPASKESRRSRRATVS